MSMHCLLVTSRHAIRNNPDFVVSSDWSSLDGNQSVVFVDAKTRAAAISVVSQSEKVSKIA